MKKSRVESIRASWEESPKEARESSLRESWKEFSNNTRWIPDAILGIIRERVAEGIPGIKGGIKEIKEITFFN